MEILEFGNKENKSIILMHGFQCPFQIWNKYIEYYKDKYHIVVPIFEGHNPKKKENFISLHHTATEIEDYYISHYGNDVNTLKHGATINCQAILIRQIRGCISFMVQN